MPELYDVLSSERVPVTISADDVRDGQDTLVRAKPSGVAFHVVFIANDATFSDPSLLAIAVDDIAAPYAGYFNEDVQVPGVLSLSTYQTFDTNNNNVSRLQVTIASSTNPDVQTTVDAPFTDAIPDRFAALVSSTQAALDNLSTGPVTVGVG